MLERNVKCNKVQQKARDCARSLATISFKLSAESIRRVTSGVRAISGPPEMGPPRPHIARDMGTGGGEISSDMGTGGGAKRWRYGDPLVI